MSVGCVSVVAAVAALIFHCLNVCFHLFSIYRHLPTTSPLKPRPSAPSPCPPFPAPPKPPPEAAFHHPTAAMEHPSVVPRDKQKEMDILASIEAVDIEGLIQQAMGVDEATAAEVANSSGISRQYSRNQLKYMSELLGICEKVGPFNQYCVEEPDLFNPSVKCPRLVNVLRLKTHGATLLMNKLGILFLAQSRCKNGKPCQPSTNGTKIRTLLAALKLEGINFTYQEFKGWKGCLDGAITTMYKQYAKEDEDWGKGNEYQITHAQDQVIVDQCE